MICVRILRLSVVLAIYAAVTLAGPLQVDAAGNEWIYEGHATLRIELVDVYGRSHGIQTFQTDVEVILDAPHPQETNPFHLVFQSKPLVNAPGEITLFSAHELVFYGGTVFLQYWTYDVVEEDESGVTFVGNLTDTHINEAAALNLLTIPTEIAPHIVMPFSKAMDAGSEIGGKFNDAAMVIVVLGNTTEGSHPFELVIEAERTR